MIITGIIIQYNIIIFHPGIKECQVFSSYKQLFNKSYEMQNEFCTSSSQKPKS